MSRRRHLNAASRATLALVGAAAFAVMLPATTAGAAPTSTSGTISVNTGHGWTHDPTTPLFDFTRIAPGWSASTTMAVRNDTDLPAAIGLNAADVVEDENGCNHPETYADTTCTGSNAGELGKEIILTVYADAGNDGSYDASPTWTGSIEALEQRVTLASQLPAGGATSYKIDAELPTSSGNETQTDQVSFDLEVALDGTSVAVQGTKITRHPGSGPLHRVLAKLPLTGTPAERLAAAGLSLLLVGTALMLAGVHRRRLRMS
jgi:hypothetical protein